jgi:hypothetical protein
VKRSAVCHAQTAAAGQTDPPLCHLDRSAAQWRDLRFLLLEYHLSSRASLRVFKALFLVRPAFDHLSTMLERIRENRDEK